MAFAAVSTFSVVVPARTAPSLDAPFVSAQQASLESQADATRLEPGPAIERPMVRGEEHRYQLPLTTGEYVIVLVEQHGIDVVVQVRSPGDNAIADFQQEILKGGEERVEVVGDRDGPYTLVVKPAQGTVAPGSYSIRIADRRAATVADRAVQESRHVRVAAARLEEAGRFAEAGTMLGRALQLVEGVRGPDDLYVTELVGDLAGNALEARDNARAETLYQRALAVLQHTLGAEHPHTAIVQSRLALLSERDGQRVKAEPQLRQACAVIEKTLGPDHPWFLRCLITMANFRDDAGDLEQAETIDRRAMAIVERSGDTETI